MDEGQSQIFDSLSLVSLVAIRDSSCGKVMFSQTCIKNSVHKGEVYTHQADNPRQTPAPLGRLPLGADMPPPKQMATAEDGTHPAGMHSWLSMVMLAVSH